MTRKRRRPHRRGDGAVVTEEPEAVDDATPQTQVPRLGASRRLDPFDNEEDGASGRPRPSPLPVPAATSSSAWPAATVPAARWSTRNSRQPRLPAPPRTRGPTAPCRGPRPGRARARPPRASPARLGAAAASARVCGAIALKRIALPAHSSAWARVMAVMRRLERREAKACAGPADRRRQHGDVEDQALGQHQRHAVGGDLGQQARQRQPRRRPCARCRPSSRTAAGAAPSAAPG